MKCCTKCGELKPLEDFYRCPGMRDGHRNDCKVCCLAAAHQRHAANPEPARERARRWADEHPDRRLAYMEEYRRSGRKQVADRKSYLKRKFGLTVGQYDAMLEAQGGVCAICLRPPPGKASLHVDHDHRTGKLRALLCFPCNNALGLLQEDPSILKRLIAYLESHHAS